MTSQKSNNQTNKKIYVAFYKHKVKIKNWQTFKEAVIDWVIRFVTKSQYSHCELVVKRPNLGLGLYDCYSSSPRDGGVRKKVMALPSDKWDLIEITHIGVNRPRNTFKKYVGKEYDWLGVLGFALHKDDKNKYFCSEYCSEILGLAETHLSPQQLYQQLTLTARG
ncbi:MAG: hypothetical protein KGV56_01895 [Gammaproteobacteria bacterium]|nr:hypothetical protein [Gammaproteobacteria bacterium]